MHPWRIRGMRIQGNSPVAYIDCKMCTTLEMDGEGGVHVRGAENPFRVQVILDRGGCVVHGPQSVMPVQLWGVFCTGSRTGAGHDMPLTTGART